MHEDDFVVMPNHVHGILWINQEMQRKGAATLRHYENSTPSVIPGSIGAIVRAYKSAVTYAINHVRTTPGAPLWQRNYYEHILRDERDYENVYAYIVENPTRWETDELNQSP